MSRRTPDTPTDPVEDYLDRLFVTLSGSPRQVRHTLAEVEAHLRDAAAEGVAAGLTEPEAQAQAVERMGPVNGVTGRGPALTRPSLALARRLALTAALIGGVAFLAIGVAGVFARLLLTVKGNEFLTAPWPAAYLTLRQRWQDRATLTALPVGTAEALGTALAALAAVVCLGQALNTEMVQHGIGAGEPWSLGVAAAVAAAAFALAFRRALRRPAPA